MGVRELLARYAAGRAHVFIVEVPGYWVVRANAEKHLLARGWCVASSPADADVLAVCGTPGPELTEAIDRVWDQMPGPRAVVEIPDAESVEHALDRALAQLVDANTQRADAQNRASPVGERDDSHSHHDDHPAMTSGGRQDSRVTQCGHAQSGHDVRDPKGADHAPHQPANHDAADRNDNPRPDHGATGHSDHHTDLSARDHRDHHHTDDAGMDHGAHGHTHHGGMDMAPAGIALAAGGEDRDGLEMDVLRVRLGPVLCLWPAGLVLDCSLQGDVLIDADAWVIDSDTTRQDRRPYDAEDQILAAARYCDHATDLLLLAGWARAASTARMARDALISKSPDQGTSLLESLHRRIGRSRILRWSLRDLAPLTVEDCSRLQLPTMLAGDSYDRLLAQAGMARRVLWDPLPPNVFHTSSGMIVDALPGLVRGLDLAAARLVIASLGIETAPEPAGGGHG